MPQHKDKKMPPAKPPPKSNGLSDKQKKNLPPALQKAILAKQKKK